MKIAIFSDNFYPELGGIQDSIASLAEELSRRGHYVTFYVPSASSKNYQVAHLPAKEMDLGKNVRVRRLFSFPFPSPTRQTRLVIPTFLRWRTVKHFDPDIIHTQTFFGVGLEALATAKFLKIPVVGTNHWAIAEFGHYVPLKAEWFVSSSLGYVTWYYNQCAYVSGPSRSVLEEMEKIGLSQPHEVVSNPIDLRTFRPAEADRKGAARKKFNFSGITLVCASRLAKEKKIDVIIRAAAIVNATVPDVTLAIAGQGAEEEALRGLAKELEIEASVRFLGILDKPTLAEAYQGSDIFVITSTSETQSMVLLQAMACGLPAIGVRWRSLPEYIKKQNGLLVEPDNPKDLAEKILLLVKDRKMREKLGRGGLLASANYSASTVAEKWEKIYEHTIAAYADQKKRVGG